MEALGGDTVLTHCRAVVRDETKRRAQHQLAHSVLSGLNQAEKGGSKTDWGMPMGPVEGPPAPAGQTTTFRGPPTAAADDWALPPETPQPRRADAPRVVRGKLINVDQVIDALRPQFEACYRHALRLNGRFGAWVIITAEVGTDGRVTSAKASGDESIPNGMLRCLEHAVRQARFNPPVGGSAIVEIPLAFTS